MQKLINWMNEKVSPVLNKITKNPWISSIQDTMMSVIPLIFVGSIVTMLSIIKEYVPNFPDFWALNAFSFGLISIFVAFLVPYNVMIKKGNANVKIVSGLASLSLFLMLLNPNFTDEGGITFVFERFGGAGMFVAIVSGLFGAFVMNIFSKVSFFNEDSSMPDFVIEWFDSMIPITLILFTGWIFTYKFNINLYDVIVNIFTPLASIGQTLPGFVLLYFIPAFLYSFGISAWVLTPIVYPIWLQAIADNATLVAQGGTATFINTSEVIFSGWCAVGGIGNTLILVILMALSKSKRLKAIGRAVMVPSIFNINEPVVYGAPIAWNPILMIPFWISSIIIPTITYIALNMGFVTIPSKVFALWYIPNGISTYMINSDFRGLILFGALLVVMFFIWYPFFKVYEIQEIKKESEMQEIDDLQLEV